MAGRIPPEFIDRLLARIDIVDVIDRRVPLKKAGHEYQARCPFHSEKTPSFTVSPQKQFYHCFGCGAHGTAIGFLMEFDQLGFPEAVEELARDAGLEVPHEQGVSTPHQPDLRPVYQTLEEASLYYAGQLREHPEAGQAVDYLKNRGVSGEIARDYRLGYAPPGWNNLIAAFGGDDGTLGRLRTAGLVSEPDGGRQYDRLRDRVVFPIRDQRGRVVGFGGRILESTDKAEPDAKPAGPKYLNSPETPVFHKGRELYGLYEARQAGVDLKSILVVEGYMDVIALAQHGIRNVVATLGTATTADHLQRLFRATPAIIFCFDGDRAGREAAWKALTVALPLLTGGREVSFMFVPEGEDPDSLVRSEGPDQFRGRMKAALPASEFLFEKLKEDTDFSRQLDGKSRLADAAKPLIQSIPEGSFRELMEQRLKEVSGGVTLGSRRPARRTP
ncbi:MAG: DNA primase, partial [Pseudomonadota bacterium]